MPIALVNSAKLKKILAALEGNWQAEMEGYHTYQTLADRDADPLRAQVLRHLAQAELEHAALWESRIAELGGTKPEYTGAPGGEADSLANRAGGIRMALRRLEIEESRHIASYGRQLKDLGGLQLAHEPGLLVPKLFALSGVLNTLNPAALGIGIGSAALIFFLKHIRPNWPGMLIAVAAASVLSFAFGLHIETIGTRFGELPHGMLMPRLPAISPALLLAILPSALSFTLLGGVESLLSAKVADSMTGRKHRSNMELVGQGIANIGSALFGGICVTGTIARTATNVRAGARTPISGILHSAFLLLFMLVAAPLASYVPLAALAGVLVAVCWNMAEKKEFWHLLGHAPSAAVLIATFGLTLLWNLTAGIVAGCVLAALFAYFRKAVPEEGE